ncbi:hypothetical protein ACIRQP_03485 [Streptomyces sp. NPDC102274]|uniref:hypothetical protein n=1 Tax=Streptomyces sp. NPDC102274 TaxID=3366151 RepID=UPI003822240B
MGRAKPSKPRRERPASETHEPGMPLPNWPSSHVSAQLTGDDQDECVKVTIHGVDHYLHATTAHELHTALGERLDQFNGVTRAAGLPGVRE